MNQEDIVLGKKILKLTKAQGLSLNQLADQAGVSRSSVQKYAKKALPQGLVTLVKISKALDLNDLNELVFDKKPNSQSLPVGSLEDICDEICELVCKEIHASIKKRIRTS